MMMKMVLSSWHFCNFVQRSCGFRCKHATVALAVGKMKPSIGLLSQDAMMHLPLKFKCKFSKELNLAAMCLILVL